jgi:hypothetical protein
LAPGSPEYDGKGMKISAAIIRNLFIIHLINTADISHVQPLSKNMVQLRALKLFHLQYTAKL